ncbi:DUF6053 domain-containing protein [Lysobacter enzymogenes]|uniref:DUF6053 domain-containing protein n=1 Tax=Lysobacter enzymogenes TaxID=69 RepID=UPI003D187C88
MGGTSVPMLSFPLAAIWNKSIGTEVPPTEAIPPTEAASPTKTTPPRKVVLAAEAIAHTKAGRRCDRDGRRRPPRRSRPGAAA